MVILGKLLAGWSIDDAERNLIVVVLDHTCELRRFECVLQSAGPGRLALDVRRSAARHLELYFEDGLVRYGANRLGDKAIEGFGIAIVEDETAANKFEVW